MLACLLFYKLLKRLGRIFLAIATCIQEQEFPSLNGARIYHTLFRWAILLRMRHQLICMSYCLQPGSKFLSNKRISFILSLRLTGGRGYTVEIYKALYVGYSILYKEHHSILVWYDMEKRHPEQLEMTAPMGGIENQTDSIKAQVTARLKSIERSVSGISSFFLSQRN